MVTKLETNMPLDTMNNYEEVSGGAKKKKHKSKAKPKCKPKSKAKPPKKGRSKKGGSVLADVSVPAGLLFLNEFFKRRSGSTPRSKVSKIKTLKKTKSKRR